MVFSKSHMLVAGILVPPLGTSFVLIVFNKNNNGSYEASACAQGRKY